MKLSRPPGCSRLSAVGVSKHLPSILIESARIPQDDELTTASILLEDGIIKRISKFPPSKTADLRIDARGLIAMPGMIDAHVHLRDLELSYKETFESGTQAAAVGGFTTVVDMPNTRPPTISAMNLTEKISQAEGKLFSNVALQGALVKDSSEIKRMSEVGAVAFKLYLNKALETFNSEDENELSASLRAAKENDVLVSIHAEDAAIIEKTKQKCLAEEKTSIRDFLRAHRPEAEVAAVRRILDLSMRMYLRVHICHISIPSAVKLVKNTTNATCEATAHHLLLNDSVFRKHGTLAICVPPIRSECHRLGLWQRFSSGQIDILASDHAPHTLEDKDSDNAWKVSPGLPGLETSLPMMFTQVSRGKLRLQRLIEATATLPAKIFGFSRKGLLLEGFDADIVLVDPKAKTRIEPEKFLSKAKYSPFKGMQCIGKPAYTIVNGTLIAERSAIVGPPVGKVAKSDKVCTSS